MKQHWLKWVAAIGLLALVAVTIHPPSHQLVKAWLDGDEFYRGKPTSYWRIQAKEWQESFSCVRSYPPSRSVLIDARFVRPPPVWTDRVANWYRNMIPRSPTWMEATLLDNDPAFRPVLLQLLQDDDADVSEAAKDALWRLEPGTGKIIASPASIGR